MRPQPKRRIFLRNPSLGAMPLPNFVFKHRTHTKTQKLNLPNFPNRVCWGPTHLSSLWLQMSALSCCHPGLEHPPRNRVRQQELCNVARRHSSPRGGRVGFIYKNQNIFLIIPRPSRITRKGEKIWLLKTTYCHPNFRRSVVVPSLPYFALVFTMLCLF